MRKKLIIAALGLVAGAALSGCQAPCLSEQIRYWRVTEIGSGQIFYTADTRSAPVNSHRPVFVSSDGKIVGLASYSLEAVDPATWTAECGAVARVAVGGTDPRTLISWCVVDISFVQVPTSTPGGAAR